LLFDDINDTNMITRFLKIDVDFIFISEHSIINIYGHKLIIFTRENVYTLPDAIGIKYSAHWFLRHSDYVWDIWVIWLKMWIAIATECYSLLILRQVYSFIEQKGIELE